MRYEFLEHTADAKFRAYGSTLEEAFGNAALAMTAVMTDVKKVAVKRTLNIAATGEDLKSLLYDFLEEFIVAVNTEHFLLSKFGKIKIKKTSSGYDITAAAAGDDLHLYETHDDVKAVTYHDMEIHEAKGNCWVQVVVDI